MRIVLIAVLAVFLGCSDKRDARVDPMVAAMKACPGDAELECARPILNVSNLRAAQSYYRDQLGFKIDWDHGDPPDFGAVSRSSLTLFMCQQCQGHPGAWVFTFAHDVDKLHTEFVQRHAKIRMPPTNMSWGIREMHVEDLDGNVIRFGGPVEH